MFSAINALMLGSLPADAGRAITQMFQRSLTAGINKYTPHDGKRQQERQRLQRQTARVLVPTKDGRYKARSMNAWLARRFPLVVTEGGAQ